MVSQRKSNLYRSRWETWQSQIELYSKASVGTQCNVLFLDRKVVQIPAGQAICVTHTHIYIYKAPTRGSKKLRGTLPLSRSGVVRPAWLMLFPLYTWRHERARLGFHCVLIVGQSSLLCILLAWMNFLLLVWNILIKVFCKFGHLVIIINQTLGLARKYVTVILNFSVIINDRIIKKFSCSRAYQTKLKLQANSGSKLVFKWHFMNMYRQCLRCRVK